MMYSSRFLALAGLLSLAASQAPVNPKFKPGAKWQVMIQDPPKVPAAGQKLVPDADIWDIDIWQAVKNPDLVKELHKREKIIICYLNLGAVQPDDDDFNIWYNGMDETKNLWNGPWYYEANLPPSEGNLYCERYVDFTKPNIRELMKKRLKTARDAGCDGVDPDNIDIAGIKWNSGYKGPTRHEVELALLDLAAFAQGMNSTYYTNYRFMIGQKNAGDMAKALSSVFDFAVLERALVKEDGTPNDLYKSFKDYLAADKPVIDIEYPASLQNPSDETNYCKTTRQNCKPTDRSCSCWDVDDQVLKKMDRVQKLDYNEYGLNGCTQYCGAGEKVVITPTVPKDDCIDKFDGKCKEDEKRVRFRCCECEENA